MDSNGYAFLVDEFELSDEELKNLSFQAKIILPLKKYLMFFVGEYAPAEYLTRSKILNPKEVKLLEAFRQSNIMSLTVCYKDEQPLLLECKY